MEINPLAKILNETLSVHPIRSMLSAYGEKLYFPKGIVTQSQEAKLKAKKFNATIGIATEGGRPMHLPSAHRLLSPDFASDEIYTYAPAAGLKPLREMWQKLIFEKNPSLRPNTTSLPLVTNAITHGLSLTGELFINPGDVVISGDKFWGNYRLMWEVKLGAVIKTFTLFDESLQKFNFPSFQSALKSERGKKIILAFNFPNNPTGYTQNVQESKRIAEILLAESKLGSRFVVMCDDAYFGMNFCAENDTESLFVKLADLHPNVLAVKLDGATKELFMWGVRMGFVTLGSKGATSEIYAALETKYSAAIRAQISNVSHLTQAFLLKTLESKSWKEEAAEKVALLKTRFDITFKEASCSEYADLWHVYGCNSGYFICLELKNQNAEALRLHLLDHKETGVIALQGGDLRIAFSCLEPDEIPEVFRVIAHSCRELQ